MTAIKERILGAVSVMSDEDAEVIWELILSNFPKKSWGDVETVLPDEWDLKMLSDIRTDPDCKEFISVEDAMKELEL